VLPLVLALIAVATSEQFPAKYIVGDQPHTMVTKCNSTSHTFSCCGQL